jgi:hypothetical protein
VTVVVSDSVPTLHRQVQTQRLLHVQLDGLRRRLEARKLGLDRIASRHERWEAIDAGGVGLRVARRIRAGVLRRDRDARDDAARRISHFTVMVPIV